MDDRAFVRRVFRWGAANGMAFLAVLAAVFLVGSLAAIPAGSGPGFLPFAAFAAPFALVVSAAAGRAVCAAMGVIHLGLVRLARPLSAANHYPGRSTDVGPT